MQAEEGKRRKQEVEETPEPGPLLIPQIRSIPKTHGLVGELTVGMRPSGRSRACQGEAWGQRDGCEDQEWEEGAYLSLSSRVCSF